MLRGFLNVTNTSLLQQKHKNLQNSNVSVSSLCVCVRFTTGTAAEHAELQTVQWLLRGPLWWDWYGSNDAGVTLATMVEGQFKARRAPWQQDDWQLPGRQGQREGGIPAPMHPLICCQWAWLTCDGDMASAQLSHLPPPKGLINILKGQFPQIKGETHFLTHL